nr:MAG: RdRP [Crassitunica tubakii mitovirus 1]
MKQTLVIKLMKWIRVFYYKDLPISHQFDRKVVHLFFLWKRTRGKAYTANSFKLARLAITRTLAGQDLPRPWGISLCKKTNLPTMLPLQVRKLILQKNFMVISWVLTVLQLSRTILGDPASYSTETITAPFTGRIPFNEASVAIVMNKMGLKPIVFEEKPFRFPWISTSGPNGLSILTSFWDILNLPENIIKCCYTLGGAGYEKSVSSLLGFQQTTNFVIAKILKLKKTPKTQHLRRLSIKEDKENKSRPFAIIDYISQSALTPLHDKLYAMLKSIEQDCTYDQNKGFKDLLYGKGPYYSYDLSSATDRFPIEIQEMVLSWLTSREYAAAWRTVMVDLPFVTPKGDMVKFETGQPLGAKSSWAMFSLSHHFIVWYCAMLCNIEQPKYKILGDDIVIQDRLLAHKYVEVMTTLGVSISPVKSHEGETLFEFAKRFGLMGVEITQFPITALLSDLKSYTNIAGVLATSVVDRGNLPLYVTSSTPRFWEGLIELSYPSGTRIFEYLVRQCKLISYLLNSYKPYLVAVSDLNKVAQAAGLDIRDLQDTFSAYKKAVMYLKDKEIEKLANMNLKANLAAQGMLMQIIFLPWRDRVTVDYRSFIPQISVIDGIKELYLDFREEFDACQDLHSLNECLDKHPIRPMPNLNGLQPVRPKLLAGQTRAALIRPFIKQLKLLNKEDPK